MAKICKNCRHWVSSEDKKPYPHYNRLPGQWGSCQLAEGFDGIPSNDTSFAFAEDVNEGNHVELTTNENFGCNQFEAKEG